MSALSKSPELAGYYDIENNKGEAECISILRKSYFSGEGKVLRKVQVYTHHV